MVKTGICSAGAMGIALAIALAASGCELVLEPDCPPGSRAKSQVNGQVCETGGEAGPPSARDAAWAVDAATLDAAWPRPIESPADAAADDKCFTVTPDFVDFGDVARGDTARRTVTLGHCGRSPVALFEPVRVGQDDSIAIDGLPHDAAWPVAMYPGDTFEFDVVFRPRVIGRDSTESISIRSRADTGFGPLRSLEIGVRGRTAWEPEACVPWVAGVDETDDPTRVVEGDRVRLVASPPPSVDMAATRVKWVLVGRPPDSNAEPLERLYSTRGAFDPPDLDDPDTPAAWLELDVGGRYSLEAQVSPPVESRCPPQVTPLEIYARPAGGDLHVRASWRQIVPMPTPDSAGASPDASAPIELIVLHPFGDAWDDDPHVARAATPSPDWGVSGPDPEDPTWVRLLGGDGGEVHVHAAAIAGHPAPPEPYRIGLRFAPLVDQPIEVEFEVFVDGEPAGPLLRATLSSPSFWDAFAIARVGAKIVVVPYDRIFSGRTLPELKAPLPAHSVCLPSSGPPCGFRLRCERDGPEAHGHCRP